MHTRPSRVPQSIEGRAHTLEGCAHGALLVGVPHLEYAPLLLLKGNLDELAIQVDPMGQSRHKVAYDVVLVLHVVNQQVDTHVF